MASTNVLITGGNRGLGLGLTKLFLAQPNHTVVVAVRDPDHPTAQALGGLTRGAGSRLVTVRYDAGREPSAGEAVAELRARHGVDHLDAVVANAGISTRWPAVKDVTRADLLEHVDVNVMGVVTLYQATRGLLKQSTADKPVFAAMGSAAAGLGQQPPVLNGVYGPSKTMLNWYGVRINAEEDWLTAFILDPGWVRTDMGNRAAEAWGMGAAPLALDDSAAGMFKVLTTATKERYGGKFVTYTGEVRDW